MFDLFAMCLLAAFAVGMIVGAALLLIVLQACGFSVKQNSRLAQKKGKESLPSEIFLSRAGHRYHLHKGCLHTDTGVSEFKICLHCAKRAVWVSSIQPATNCCNYINSTKPEARQWAYKKIVDRSMNLTIRKNINPTKRCFTQMQSLKLDAARLTYPNHHFVRSLDRRERGIMMCFCRVSRL